jgi:hypothetical protein
VFLSAVPQRARADADRNLRGVIGSDVSHQELSEVTLGRQPLAFLPRALAQRAAGVLENVGLRARVVPKNALHRALPMNFVVMVVAVLLVGSYAGLRGAPLFLPASPLLAAALLFAANLQLGKPLLATPASTALLPEHVRESLADALADLRDERARTLLLDIARTGEATFSALPEAFRTAALGESVVELLSEAGPLAREAAHLREIATELGVRSEQQTAVEGQQIDEAANARYALLENVLALLGRVAREGAQSHEEVSQLVQQVREESSRRVEAENAVSALLSS